jgi:DNA-directed RNA polymerase specialized sigma24 family protein
MSELDPETRRKYLVAISNLPWLQREIFELSRFEDLSCAEIGVLMGLSPRYIERQFAKALYKIGKQIDGEKLSWWERWF